jgi:hypothetical protein
MGEAKRKARQQALTGGRPEPALMPVGTVVRHDGVWFHVAKSNAYRVVLEPITDGPWLKRLEAQAQAEDEAAFAASSQLPAGVAR